MDYIDYMLNKHYKENEISENMEKLGINNIDDYYNYLEDKKAEAEIEQFEAVQGI